MKEERQLKYLLIFSLAMSIDYRIHFVCWFDVHAIKDENVHILIYKGCDIIFIFPSYFQFFTLILCIVSNSFTNNV